MDGHSPGAGVCGEGFSSKNGIQFSFLLQAMFEPLQWVSNATRTGSQVREEDHLREARVVRSNHMSNPPQLWFHDECLNALHVGSAQQFCLGDFIFPGDAHNRLCLELPIIFQRWNRFVKFVHSDEIFIGILKDVRRVLLVHGCKVHTCTPLALSFREFFHVQFKGLHSSF